MLDLMINLSNTELWAIAVATALTCVLAGFITNRDMKVRSSWKDSDPFSHEPILWGEPGSWWKVPIYRMEKMLFVDVISPSGAFAGVMTHIWIRQFVEVTKSSVWGGLCMTALFLLAWTNFALPKYRPQFVGALIDIIRAFATFIAGKRWGGGGGSTTSSATSTTTTSSATVNSPNKKEPPPVE